MEGENRNIEQQTPDSLKLKIAEEVAAEVCESMKGGNIDRAQINDLVKEKLIAVNIAVLAKLFTNKELLNDGDGSPLIREISGMVMDRIEQHNPEAKPALKGELVPHSSTKTLTAATRSFLKTWSAEPGGYEWESNAENKDKGTSERLESVLKSPETISKITLTVRNTVESDFENARKNIPRLVESAIMEACAISNLQEIAIESCSDLYMQLRDKIAEEVEKLLKTRDVAILLKNNQIILGKVDIQGGVERRTCNLFRENTSIKGAKSCSLFQFLGAENPEFEERGDIFLPRKEIVLVWDNLPACSRGEQITVGEGKNAITVPLDKGQRKEVIISTGQSEIFDLKVSGLVNPIDGDVLKSRKSLVTISRVLISLTFHQGKELNLELPFVAYNPNAAQFQIYTRTAATQFEMQPSLFSAQPKKPSSFAPHWATEDKSEDKPAS